MTTSGSVRKRKRTTNVPEDSVTCQQQEVDHTQKKFGLSKWRSSCGSMSRGDLALSEGEIAALTTSMRQIGVGAPHNAEALAIFHQLFYDEWMTRSPSGSLARITVDGKNCFGMVEWQAVREAASRFLPKHMEAAAWKHRSPSQVEQEGLRPPMPKDRGAEQRDVNGSVESSLALGMVAAETRRRVAAQQATSSLP